MKRTPRLNHSSPIVQRVLRVRAGQVKADTTAEQGARASAAERAQSRTGYQWQMWQKSDLSAYLGGGVEHRCKEIPRPSGKEVDESEMQRVPVLSQGLCSGGQLD